MSIDQMPDGDRRVGDFRLIKPLGEGGMGSVYLAASPSGRAVAVKIMHDELVSKPGFRRRFRTEIETAQELSGAFTAMFVDADPDGTPPWLATEYIAGPSLRDAVGEFGAMTEADLLLLAAGVAEALAAIHRADRIHRDLTPMNVLLAQDGPRVIDFGISRFLDEGGIAAPSSQILGTPGYMSPERIRGEPSIPAGDVFALGALLVFAAQGCSPFGDVPDQILVKRTLYEEPQLDGVPPRLRGVFADCLNKDPGQRPPAKELPARFREGSATAWAAPLARRVREQERTLNATVRSSRLTRRRALLGAGALAITAACGRVLAESSGPSAAPSPLKSLWAADLPRGDMTLSGFDASTVVCADRAGACSFDSATGAKLWTESASGGAADSSDGTRVYSVHVDGRIHAFDARTGRQLWVSAFAGSPTIQLITSTVLVASDNGSLRAIESDSGATRWSYQPPGVLIDVIRATTGRQLVVSGTDVANTGSTNIFSYAVLALDSGKQLWTGNFVDLAAPSTGPTYYAIDTEMNLLALQASNGKQIWSRQTQLPSQVSASLIYTGSLQLNQGTVYCYPSTEGNASGTGILAAFDARNGKTLWAVYPSSDTGGFAVAEQSVCYLDGAMKAADVRTGKLLWSAGADLGSLQFAGTAAGLFLAAGADGLHGWNAATGQHAWHYPASGGSGNWSFLHTPGGVLAARAARLYAFGSS